MIELTMSQALGLDDDNWVCAYDYASDFVGWDDAVAFALRDISDLDNSVQLFHLARRADDGWHGLSDNAKYCDAIANADDLAEVLNNIVLEEHEQGTWMSPDGKYVIVTWANIGQATDWTELPDWAVEGWSNTDAMRVVPHLLGSNPGHPSYAVEALAKMQCRL